MDFLFVCFFKKTTNQATTKNNNKNPNLFKYCMIFPEVCVHGHVTATSLKRERGNKKEFEGSGTRERSHLGSATRFCQNIIHVADNIEIYTIRFNSQTLTEAIHQPFQAAACKCLVCICHLCHTDFVHLGFLTQKVLFRRGGKNGFKELLLNMGNSFGRGQEVRSELSF